MCVKYVCILFVAMLIFEINYMSTYKIIIVSV